MPALFSGWTSADPGLTFVVVALIGFSSLRRVREALHGLMERIPLHERSAGRVSRLYSNSQEADMRISKQELDDG